MKRMRFCGHILYHRYPLNMSQNRILMILKKEGAMKQRELMEHMNIQAGSLSEIIAKVEAGGFIERVRSEGDKRNFELSLTEAGRERAEIFERERDEMARELFGILDDEKKEQLYDILGILLEKWREGFEGCCSHKKEEKTSD